MIDIVVMGDLTNFNVGDLRLNKPHSEYVTTIYVTGKNSYTGPLNAKIKVISNEKLYILVNNCLTDGTSQFVAIVDSRLKIKDTAWIKRSVNFLNSRPAVCSIGLAGWKQINSDGSPVQESYTIEDMKLVNKTYVDKDIKMKNPVERVVMLNGPFMVLRKFIGVSFAYEAQSIMSEYASLWANRQGYQSWVMNIGVVNTDICSVISDRELGILQELNTGIPLDVNNYGEGSAIIDTGDYLV